MEPTLMGRLRLLDDPIGDEAADAIRMLRDLAKDQFRGLLSYELSWIWETSSNIEADVRAAVRRWKVRVREAGLEMEVPDFAQQQLDEWDERRQGA